jgi:hypothetical protein
MFRVGRNQRGGATAPYSNLNQRPGIQFRGLLNEPPEFEAPILVDEPSVLDLRIDYIESFVDVPRAIGRTAARLRIQGPCSEAWACSEHGRHNCPPAI